MVKKKSKQNGFLFKMQQENVILKIKMRSN